MEIVVEENPREHAGRKEKQNAYEEWVYKEWVNSIERKIPTSPSHPCNSDTAIFRVPEHIRGGNENAYEPRVVSIGPYHRAREKLVDKHKWRYVQAILQRNPSKSLENYLNGIKELEDRARRCYRETTEIQKIESNDFVEMMFVDGCFLVELFLKRLDRVTPKKEIGQQGDIIYSDQLLAFYLECDLCLLENQLPYFILESIFESVMSNHVNDLTTYFVLVANKFKHCVSFKETLPSDKANRSALLASLAITFIPRSFRDNMRSHVAVGEEESFHHLLHLFHFSFSPDPEKKPEICQKLKNAIHSIFSRPYSHGSTSSAGEKPEQLPSPENSMFKKLKSVIVSMFWGSHESAASSGETVPSKFPCLHSRENHEPSSSMPSVTKLDDAGVNFRRAENPGSILSIKFECGVMKIPYLFIDDSTNLFFRNLIAFEQCRQDVSPYFSEYAALMDFLINTRKDIEILSKNRIIEHGLGSDKEVALLFNRLCKGILVNLKDLTIFNKVTNYYSNCWHRSRADLCRKYFSSPWSILSLIAGIILLLLTVAQTILSVLSYFRPTS